MHLPGATAGRSKRDIRLPIMLLLVAAELLAISLAYQHEFSFTCRAHLPDWLCAALGRMVPRAIGASAAIGLFAAAHRGALQGRAILRPGPIWRPLALHAAGFVLILAPWAGLSDTSPPATITLALVSWSAGMALSLIGLVLSVATVEAWRDLLRRHGPSLSGLLAIGLAAPELADRLRPLWHIEGVTELTFSAVVQTLESLGHSVLTLPDEKLIGTHEFVIAVGAECAGVEGAVLIALFVTLYIFLFRKDLRFPQVLLLYPLGLLLSWGFNILRISALLLIGLGGYPELAIGGFHSHAGWLAFTGLSLLLILLARNVPALRRAPPPNTGHISPCSPPTRFFTDPQVARLLPFAVMMSSVLMISTLSATPVHLYPWRALAMAVGLAPFLPFLRDLCWRIDFMAIGIGVGVAVVWGLAAPSVAETSQSAPQGGLWLLARLLGTVLLVPVIEELFFRDYLLSLLPGKRLAAAVLSTASFAALHDRWIVAAFAGVAFLLLRLKRQNVTAAILAHMVANGLIALWALFTGNWQII